MKIYKEICVPYYFCDDHQEVVASIKNLWFPFTIFINLDH